MGYSSHGSVVVPGRCAEREQASRKHVSMHLAKEVKNSEIITNLGFIFKSWGFVT